MDYHTFISAVIANLQQRLGEEYTISSESIIKNNNIVYDALLILHNENTSPVIYLQEYYKQYLSHNNLNIILEDILKIYSSYEHTMLLDNNFLSDFDSLKPKIAYKLINYNANCQLLSNTPYIPFLDLAIVFYIHMNHPSLGYMSILIKNQYLDIWKITVSSLFDIAHENTYRLLGCRLESIEDVLLNLSKEKSTDIIPISCKAELNDSVLCQLSNIKSISEDSRFTMYILSNQIGTFGASCILYPDVIKSIANYLVKDIIILPSSIHGATRC